MASASGREVLVVSNKNHKKTDVSSQIYCEPLQKSQSKNHHSKNFYRKYNVYLLKDHYTTPDFIISILKQYFYMGSIEAQELMQEIHREGRAKCGLFTYEIAEIKVLEVNELARRKQYPLLCIMEESSSVNA